MQYGRCLQYTIFEIVTNQKLMRIIVTNTIRFDTATMYAVLVLLGVFCSFFFYIYIYILGYSVSRFSFSWQLHTFRKILCLCVMYLCNLIQPYMLYLFFCFFFCLVVWVFCKYVYIYLVILYFPWQLHVHAMQCDLSGKYYVNCKNSTFSFAMSYPVFFPTGVELHAV